MTVRIIFSNTTGEFLIQDGNREYSFKATSGKDNCMNNKECENKPNIGPTPVGAYYIIPSQLDDPTFILDARRRVVGDWGDFRIEIYAQANTNTHGRSKMFIHGGGIEGSKGCIDIGGGLLGDKNSDKIKELIKNNAAQGVIRVDVINGKILEFHKNQPREVILPKNLRSEIPNHSYTVGENSMYNFDLLDVDEDLKTFFANYTKTDEFKLFDQKEAINDAIITTDIEKQEAISTQKRAMLNSDYYTKRSASGFTQADLDEANEMMAARDMTQVKSRSV